MNAVGGNTGTNDDQVIMEEQVSSETEAAFGPWMVVARKARPYKDRSAGRQVNPPVKGDSNRFVRLETVENGVTGRGVTTNKNSGKENHVPGAVYVTNSRTKTRKQSGQVKRHRPNDSAPVIAKEPGPSSSKASQPRPALQPIVNAHINTSGVNNRRTTSLSKPPSTGISNPPLMTKTVERMERKAPGVMIFTTEQVNVDDSSIMDTQAAEDNMEVTSNEEVSQIGTVVPETQA